MMLRWCPPAHRPLITKLMVFHRGHTLSPYYLAFWNLGLWFYRIFICFCLILFHFLFFLLFSFNYFYLLSLFIWLDFILCFILFNHILSFILFLFCCIFIYYLLIFLYFSSLLFFEGIGYRGTHRACALPAVLTVDDVYIYIFLGLRVLICGLRVDVFWYLARADECCALYISNRLHRL